MRTTVRIDDDLLRELKRQAHQENASLTQLVNQAIRRGLAPEAKKRRTPKFRQATFAMGPPLVNLDKSLALADALEDEEVMRKLALRK